MKKCSFFLAIFSALIPSISSSHLLINEFVYCRNLDARPIDYSDEEPADPTHVVNNSTTPTLNEKTSQRLHRYIHDGAFHLYLVKKVLSIDINGENLGVIHDNLDLCRTSDNGLTERYLGAATLFGNKGWIVTAQHLLTTNNRYGLKNEDGDPLTGFIIKGHSFGDDECYSVGDWKTRTEGEKNVKSWAYIPRSDIDIALLKIKDENFGDNPKRKFYIPRIHFGYTGLTGQRLNGMGFQLRGDEVPIPSTLHDVQIFASAQEVVDRSVSGVISRSLGSTFNGYSGSMLFDLKEHAYAIHTGRPDYNTVTFAPFFLIANEILGESSKFFDVDNIFKLSPRYLNDILRDDFGKASAISELYIGSFEKHLKEIGLSLPLEAADVSRANAFLAELKNRNQLNTNYDFDHLKHLSELVKCTHGQSHNNKLTYFAKILKSGKHEINELVAQLGRTAEEALAVFRDIRNSNEGRAYAMRNATSLLMATSALSSSRGVSMELVAKYSKDKVSFELADYAQQLSQLDQDIRPIRGDSSYKMANLNTIKAIASSSILSGNAVLIGKTNALIANHSSTDTLINGNLNINQLIDNGSWTYDQMINGLRDLDGKTEGIARDSLVSPRGTDALERGLTSEFLSP